MSDDAGEISKSRNDGSVLVASGAWSDQRHLVQHPLELEARITVAGNLENESGANLVYRVADSPTVKLARRSSQIAHMKLREGLKLMVDWYTQQIKRPESLAPKARLR